jgi:hypothetical protein
MIAFKDGSILNVKAAYSVTIGVYRIDVKKTQIELGVMIRAYCGDDSQSNEFIPL